MWSQGRWQVLPWPQLGVRYAGPVCSISVMSYIIWPGLFLDISTMHDKFISPGMFLEVVSNEGHLMQPHFFLQGMRIRSTTNKVWNIVVKPWISKSFQQIFYLFHLFKMTQEWLVKNFHDLLAYTYSSLSWSESLWQLCLGNY